jgi:glycosyltransferase involved in cell wall biosynthesis
MKIWMPTLRASSGADVFTQRLAGALRSVGLEVVLDWYPLQLEYRLMPSAVRVPPGTDIVQLNSWHASAFRIAALPRVVVAHHCVHGAAGRAAGTRAQRLYHRWWIRRAEAAALHFADRVVCVSQSTADAYREVFGRADLDVIHSPVDIDLFRPAPPRDHGGPFRLLFVGNLTWRKGADGIDPLARMLGRDFEIWCTGGLRQGAFGISAENVRHTPAAGDAEMARLYHECDAVLCLSRLEGFGYAAAEGAASGRPVVAFRSSSLPEIVIDEETGLLAEPGDLPGIAEACRRLARDESLAQRLGEAGRARVEAQFAPAVLARQYVALYRQILAAPP